MSGCRASGTSRTPSPRWSSASTQCSITTRCRKSGSTRSTSPACTSGRRAAPPSRRTRSRSARKLTRNDAIATLAGEGSECTLNGLYVGGRRPPDRQPHDDRSCRAALPEPRDLQGHPRRQGARGVQRQDHRPPGRAEDRRQADQPGTAPLGRRDDQYQAAARDLRRRREVYARRGDRAARRRRAVLPARPRPDIPGGARHADPRVCRRHPRPRQDRAAENRAGA